MNYQTIKILLLLGTIVLLIFPHIPLWKKQFKKVSLILFIVIAVLSLASYFNFGQFHSAKFIHYWDAYHYYMGGKYFKELGYTDLYRATILAIDQEDIDAFSVQEIRDLDTYTIKSVDITSFKSIEMQFSPSRWQEFKNDIAFFSTKTTAWQGILLDHGYNAPPAWAALMLPLLNTLPLQDATLLFFAVLDYALVLFAFFFVAKTFGKKAGLLSLIFFCLNFANGYQYIGGSILRYLWFSLLLLCLCFLQRKKYYLAGIAIALAALQSVFPIVFAGIILIKGSVNHLKRKNSNTERKVMQQFLITIVLLSTLALLILPQKHYYTEYINNMKYHSTLPSTNRVSFRLMNYYQGEQSTKDIATGPHPYEIWRQHISSQSIYLPYLIGGFIFLIVIYLSRYYSLLYLMQYGAILLFFFAHLTNYYYSFLTLFFMLPFIRKKKHVFDILKMLLLLSIMIASYAIERFISFQLLRYYLFSSLLFCFFIGVLVLDILQLDKRFKKTSFFLK